MVRKKRVLNYIDNASEYLFKNMDRDRVYQNINAIDNIAKLCCLLWCLFTFKVIKIMTLKG